MKKYPHLIIGLMVIAVPSLALSQASANETTSVLESEGIATSTPVTQTEGPAVGRFLSYAEIVSAEEAYFAKHGKYLQVLPGNTLPSYEEGTVETKLGWNVPLNASVDVYSGPRGQGFSVSYMEAGVRYTQGYGPDAALFTHTQVLDLEADFASTTDLRRSKSPPAGQ